MHIPVKILPSHVLKITEISRWETAKFRSLYYFALFFTCNWAATHADWGRMHQQADRKSE